MAAAERVPRRDPWDFLGSRQDMQRFSKADDREARFSSDIEAQAIYDFSGRARRSSATATTGDPRRSFGLDGTLDRYSCLGLALDMGGGGQSRRNDRKESCTHGVTTRTIVGLPSPMRSCSVSVPGRSARPKAADIAERPTSLARWSETFAFEPMGRVPPPKATSRLEPGDLPREAPGSPLMGTARRLEWGDSPAEKMVDVIRRRVSDAGLAKGEDVRSRASRRASLPAGFGSLREQDDADSSGTDAACAGPAARSGPVAGTSGSGFETSQSTTPSAPSVFSAPGPCMSSTADAGTPCPACSSSCRCGSQSSSGAGLIVGAKGVAAEGSGTDSISCGSLGVQAATSCSGAVSGGVDTTSPQSQSTKSPGSPAKSGKIMIEVTVAMRERMAMLEELFKNGTPPQFALGAQSDVPYAVAAPAVPATWALAATGQPPNSVAPVVGATVEPSAPAAQQSCGSSTQEPPAPKAESKGKGKGPGKVPGKGTPPPHPNSAASGKGPGKGAPPPAPDASPGAKGKGKGVPGKAPPRGPGTPQEMKGSAKAGPTPSKADVQPKLPMKRLFWNSFLVEREQSDCLWVSLDEVVFDAAELEQLFAEAAPGRRGSESRRSTITKARVFEETRRRQVCIMLARLPIVELTIHAVTKMDDMLLDKDQVELLLANAPPPEELAALNKAAAEAEPALDWDTAEAFVLALSQVPSFSLRLQIWSFETHSRSGLQSFMQLAAMSSRPASPCRAPLRFHGFCPWPWL